MKARSKLLGDAAIYTASNFAVAGVPFLLLPILTRVLSPDAYGKIAMFSVVVPLFAVGAGVSVHGAIMVRYFNPEGFHIPTYVSTCLAILAATTTAILASVLVFGSLLAEITSIPQGFLIVATIVAGMQFVVQSQLVLWQSSKQPLKFGALRLLQALLDGTLSALFVVALSLSWQGRIAGMTLAWCISAVIALMILHRDGWMNSRVDIKHAKDALRYGVPLIPHALGGIVLAMADRFMVTNLLNINSTGIYIVAVQIGAVLGIAADAFNRAFAPWLMESLKTVDASRDRKIVLYTYGYFFLIISLSIIGAITAPILLPLIAGPEYQSALKIAPYMLIGNSFVGMYYMVTNYIFHSRRTELLSALTVTVGAITIGLSWLLIKRNGLEGAAQAFMIGQILLFIGTWALANHCHKMPWGIAALVCKIDQPR